MKHLFTTLTAFSLSFIGFSQGIEIHENGVAISGAAITIDSVVTADHTIGNYYIVNTTGASVDIDWARVRRAHMAPFHDQVCDDVYCYEATNTTIFPSPTSKTIAAGDSMIFQPKVYADGVAGCVIYSYMIYTDHGSTLEDSIQVKIRFGGQDCFLEVPETPIYYSVYPNPVSSVLNIKATTNGNSVEVKVYNIMGELVAKDILVDGLNTLSVTTLTDGIYFYSVVKNGEIIETKKLIVRH